MCGLADRWLWPECPVPVVVERLRLTQRGRLKPTDQTPGGRRLRSSRRCGAGPRISPHCTADYRGGRHARLRTYVRRPRRRARGERFQRRNRPSRATTQAPASRRLRKCGPGRNRAVRRTLHCASGSRAAFGSACAVFLEAANGTAASFWRREQRQRDLGRSAKPVSVRLGGHPVVGNVKRALVGVQDEDE